MSPKQIRSKINLSELTLDIDTGKFKIDEFDWAEIEEYVRALTEGRKFQIDAIKQLLIYLWGGKYSSINELAKANYKKKAAIQQRYPTEEIMQSQIPLPQRLSGVCYMATGTGKSYVIFAIAYLSIILEKVKRVLVLGPPSTIIEKGLTDKFREYLNGSTGLKLKEKLPEKYRNIHINLCNANDIVDDNCIVIENINAIYTKSENAITDMLFKHTNEVLVLSDEVHHAYNHLSFGKATLSYDFEGEKYGTGEDKNERLWMKFIREEAKIKRHLGFTGTPYNQNDFFPDVIVDYSIKDALEEGIIKKINPILKVTSTEEDNNLTPEQKFEQIIKTHFDNKNTYSYKGKVKPITIFINNTQPAANSNADLFIQVYSLYLQKHNKKYVDLSLKAIEQRLREDKVVIVATSNTSKAEYEEQLHNIEETNPNKSGGKTEFIFAVNKLSEGWDVDNVFQIVPMQERVFNSKLLISQVLGRGLRLPRKVSYVDLKGNYPVVTITNHEKFAETIKNLLDEVRECDLIISSRVVLSNKESDRFSHHFTLFNLDYNLVQEIVDKDKDTTGSRSLLLKPEQDSVKLDVTYLMDKKKFELSKERTSVDEIVSNIYRKFKMVTYEHSKFEFGDGLDITKLDNKTYIKSVIEKSMQETGISGNLLSNENKKAIELYFNSFLPKGDKSVRFSRVIGDLKVLKTLSMSASSLRAGALEQDSALFVSDDWETELPNEHHTFITEIGRTAMQSDAQTSIFDKGIVDFRHDLIKKPYEGKRFFIVNASALKTPQNCVISSHTPETNFIIMLIEHAMYLESWVKSPDMSFYSLDYEYWKKGKDRVRRSFNPDFFIRINISKYLKQCGNAIKEQDKKKLHGLRDNGIRDIICVVEIKSDDDYDEITLAKEEFGKNHFMELNEVLKNANPIDLNLENPLDKDQIYFFSLLREGDFNNWFRNLKDGHLKV